MATKLYEVLVDFFDGQDGRKFYAKGWVYPKGHTPTEERIEELSSSENALGKPVIREKPLTAVAPEVAEEADEVEDEVVEEVEVDDEPAEYEEDDHVDVVIEDDKITTWEDLTIPQLKKVLDERGLEYKSKDNKSALIKKLENE